MMKTLMTHAFAFGGMAAMVGGLIVAGAPEAESRATHTTNIETQVVTTKSISPAALTTAQGPSQNLGYTDENNIEPAAGPESNAPVTRNVYESSYQRQQTQEVRY
jgi:hypothetical protein